MWVTKYPYSGKNLETFLKIRFYVSFELTGNDKKEARHHQCQKTPQKKQGLRDS